MKNIISGLAISILCFVYSSGHAQLMPLQVGDPLPELLLREIFNYHSDTLNTKSLKGKIVIFEFWGVTCIPCLESFPKLDSIQKAFGKDLQIVLVNRENRKETQEFFKKHPGVFLPRIPFATADSSLHALFPHRGNPFSFWIGKDGRVQFKDLEVTASNIRSVIDGKPVKIPDFVNSYMKSSIIEEKWRSDVVYSSVLLRSTDLGMSLRKVENGGGTAEKGTIPFLFTQAYERLTGGQYKLHRPGRVVLEVKEKQKYIIPNNLDQYDLQQWLKKNCYVYQSIMPAGTAKNVDEIMVEDLQRAFGIKSMMERRNVPSLVMVKIGNTRTLNTKGGKPRSNFTPTIIYDEVLHLNREMINMPFSNFSKKIASIAAVVLKRQLVDQVGFEGNIDLKVETAFLDDFTVERFNSVMKKHGIEIIEKDIEMDVLVLQEIN